MFIHDSRLPHLLAPNQYDSEEATAREWETVLGETWHLVGSVSELRTPGSFLTTELNGISLQIRNFEGELRALSNVCAHRHCAISSLRRGKSPKMVCPYHGWEYGADGRTRHIPSPKNFAPFDREALRLPAYPLETCGDLAFVRLSATGPSLQAQLGALYEKIADRFGPGFSTCLRYDAEYPANWKVPIENSLEAYHVPLVHPHTFREDPGSARSEHGLEERRTWFATKLPFSPHSKIDAFFQSCEHRLLALLGLKAEGRYEQHHVFPNLLFSFTDVVSFAQCVVPASKNSSRAVVRQYARNGANCVWWRQAIASIWGMIEGTITKRIVLEDLGMFAQIQTGLASSPHAGTLGACEERIWAFQRYLAERTRRDESPASFVQKLQPNELPI